MNQNGLPGWSVREIRKLANDAGMRYDAILKMVLKNGLEVTRTYLEETIELIASINEPIEEPEPAQSVQKEQAKEPDRETQVHERNGVQGSAPTGTGSSDVIERRSEPGTGGTNDFLSQLSSGSAITFREE